VLYVLDAVVKGDLLMPPKMTRGSGLLEAFLARKRHAVAESLIPSAVTRCCIVDLGCGNYPAFLMTMRFSQKIGLDKEVDPDLAKDMREQGVHLIQHDMDSEEPLPIPTESCDVVTMLAVLEHIRPSRVMDLMREIHRILKPGGICIITTPSGRTASLLRIMARLGLVSAVEIEDHKHVYRLSEIRSLLLDAGFPPVGLESGHFELGMNCWAKAAKRTEGVLSL
jgi:SAM-dependent methyltransferase